MTRPNSSCEQDYASLGAGLHYFHLVTSVSFSGESIRPCATQASKRSARVLGPIINVVPLSKEKFKNTEKKS